jgi:hypothetical protein
MPNNTFNVALALDITKADGSAFFSSHDLWSGLDYPSMVLIERKLTDFLAALVTEGEQRAAAAPSGGQG